MHDRHLLPRSARDEAGRTLRGMPPAAGVRRSSHGKMSVYGDKDVLQCLQGTLLFEGDAGEDP